MEFNRVIEVMNAALLSVMERTDFDLLPSEDGHELDITTDTWTIHLNDAGGGFFAIDDEPVEAVAYAAARRQSLAEKVERVIAAADRELGGVIVAAMKTTGDPFSLEFAAALEAIAG